ncbi:A/G-specific adenine glycosylase [Flavobacteriaceae bacterium F89]|uniref:Adenine DNA glycosylase n=1 Tax=Cerina litoralis TaxID=2874477 RepID=A0AAE3JNS0_9FLAO|nr:A/G-specific adenine glycosylase [Cerina litoralis]MCG2460201.1 A/G-specific adenine glycosylase [Cerina litoralis]
MTFSETILSWYRENKRELPWRDTKDPYRIWLSEIILQQTRIAQGTPYYEKFLANFPTIEHLSNATEAEVLKLWQGLGYYSRARNLHATSKTVVQKYGGKFPSNYIELMGLKGIGDYTASAIASICFDEPRAVVDGNVYRVLSRYFGVEIPINSTKGVKYFKALAQSVMDAEHIGDYNQGTMEFGAVQCVPKSPDCPRCPLNKSCLALQKNLVDRLPVKMGRIKVRKRYFNYLVVMDRAGKTQLRQRLGKGIWENLYEFPKLDSDRELKQKQVESSLSEVLQLEEPPLVYQYGKGQVVHKLSHLHLHTKFWVVETCAELKNGVALSDLEHYPVPVLVANFISSFKNHYF